MESFDTVNYHKVQIEDGDFRRIICHKAGVQATSYGKIILTQQSKGDHTWYVTCPASKCNRFDDFSP